MVTYTDPTGSTTAKEIGCAFDWNTGEVKWETTWENKGSIVFSDGMFYLYEEKREMWDCCSLILKNSTW